MMNEKPTATTISVTSLLMVFVVHRHSQLYGSSGAPSPLDISISAFTIIRAVRS